MSAISSSGRESRTRKRLGRPKMKSLRNYDRNGGTLSRPTGHGCECYPLMFKILSYSSHEHGSYEAPNVYTDPQMFLNLNSLFKYH